MQCMVLLWPPKPQKKAREIANWSGLVEQKHDLETGKSDYNPSTKNNIWLYPKYTKLQKIGIAAKNIKKGIILEDVNMG